MNILHSQLIRIKEMEYLLLSKKAEVLLLLGTKLSSDVYSNYVKFFEGEQIVVIHEKEHYTDCKADMVIYDQPGKVLSNLGYDF